MINDFKYTKDDDLLIVDGELFFDDSTQHHANNILKLNKGEDKFFPTLGCNLLNYVNGLTPREVIARNIRAEFLKVGIKAKTVVVADTISVTDATYR
jgi:hypothetical protein